MGRSSYLEILQNGFKPTIVKKRKTLVRNRSTRKNRVQPSEDALATTKHRLKERQNKRRIKKLEIHSNKWLNVR